jgi:hypothetical protein
VTGRDGASAWSETFMWMILEYQGKTALEIRCKSLLLCTELCTCTFYLGVYYFTLGVQM